MAFPFTCILLVVASCVPWDGRAKHLAIMHATIFGKQVVKILKAAPTLKMKQHKVSDTAAQAIYHRCKLDGARKLFS